MSKAKPIINAEEIIERFGGIRPMAKKMDVAVTTVQGWKKRGKIPARRLQQIQTAANDHSVEIRDLLTDDSTGDTPKEKKDLKAKEKSAIKSNPENTKPVEDKRLNIDAQDESRAADTDTPDTTEEHTEPSTSKRYDFEERLITTEKKAVTKSLWLTVLLTLAGLAFMAFVFFPSQNPIREVEKNTQRLQVIEQDIENLQQEVESVKSRQSFFSTIVPEDLDKRIENLQDQATTARNGLEGALQKVEAISNDVLSDTAGTLTERLSKLEGHLDSLNLGNFNLGSAQASPDLLNVLDRIRIMGVTLSGRTQLDGAVQDLNDTLNMVGDTNDTRIGTALDNARTKSNALGTAFAEVPQNDLKAAALLLGMTQFRDSLNREAPFADDLALVSKLVGEDNPELMASLERLAPHAEQGVMSMPALSNSFKKVAGDAVVASLNGEDVSIQDRLGHQLSDFLKIEKDGQRLGATPTEATVSRAQNLLDQGDVLGAITALETLEGDAAVAVSPWIAEMKASMQAQQIGDVLDRAIESVSSNTAP